MNTLAVRHSDSKSQASALKKKMQVWKMQMVLSKYAAICP